MTQRDVPTSPKQPCERDDALAVLKRLREAGHVAYFAGGCVRDELMGLVPKDYDVATDAPPQRVRELFTSTQAVGAAFGVILVRHRRSVVEVATFRADVSYEDGRHPTAVRFTTAEEDAKRRDFTINGLFLDPVENRVIDYVGGQADIRSRVIRAIGDPSHRFDEDHLRLLRAVRFASRFDFQIEPNTATAIERHAPKLARISPERIADELRAMLTPTSRRAAWQSLVRFRLDEVIFRFLELPWSPAHPEVRGHRSLALFERVAPREAISFGLSLAATTLEYAAQRLPHLGEFEWLWQKLTTRGTVKAARAALRISNDESDEMEGTLYGVEHLLASESHSVAALKRFLARPTARSSRVLARAIAECGLFVERVRSLEQRLDELEKTEVAPAPLVNGDDLVARGLSPGRAFKRALDFVYDEQLEGRVTTREQALELGERKVREFEAQGHAG